jgi:hypothetical protein
LVDAGGVGDEKCDHIEDTIWHRVVLTGDIGLPIVDCQFPIGVSPKNQLAIGNCKSAIDRTHPLPQGGTDLMGPQLV